MPDFIQNMTHEVFRLWREFYWLPEWLVITVIISAFVFIGWAANQVVFGLLQWAVRKRDVYWRGVVAQARLKVRIAVMIIAIGLGATISPLDPGPSLFIRQVLIFAFILVCGWMAAGAVDMGAVVHLRKFDMDSEDNLHARKHVTQTRILQRVAALLIALISLGLALLTIPGVRQWGMSLLASAGVVGIVAGLALQPFLTNMIAGIQIATSQPIRLDDAVLVEGERGQIEEITSTYVVVKLWDWRRMVLPLTYFIQRPFQNWTRDDARLIGVTLLYVDYEAPIDRLRAHLETVAQASPLWDGDVVALQVTDINNRTAQVRCLTSARNASNTFDLRCDVREQMLAFMRDHCREALPRDRIDLERVGSDHLPPLPGEGG